MQWRHEKAKEWWEGMATAAAREVGVAAGEGRGGGGTDLGEHGRGNSIQGRQCTTRECCDRDADP